MARWISSAGLFCFPGCFMIKLRTMLNKIFLIAFGVLVLPTALITWYAGSWLTSIGDPKIAQAKYFDSSGWGLTSLLVSFVILLILANIILWSSRRAWALWLSFLYFALFVILRFWWLEGDYLDFARRNALTESTFSLGPLIAAGLIILVGALVFFDQFVALRLAEKMHPTRVESDSAEDESEASQLEPPVVTGD